MVVVVGLTMRAWGMREAGPGEGRRLSLVESLRLG